MAKDRQIGVGVNFKGDASGLEKAAAGVGKSTKAIRKEIKDVTGVFDELGNAVGGIGGEVASAVSGLATAASGVGALVVVVGALAKAWQLSQENIDLYLKSADKLKAGSVGFSVDTETARVDARKRGSGMIALGAEQYRKASRLFANALYDGDKANQAYYSQLMDEALLLQQNGKLLKESVVGVDAKSDFQRNYNALLVEEEKLRDEGLANATRWEGLEANQIKQRSIIQDKESTSLEKSNAVNEAERIAAQLLKEKGEYIDRELTNVNAIAEMTQTQEVVEEKVADLKKQQNTIQKDYGLDMIKVLRMESRATKEAETQVNLEEKKLKLLKEQQTTLSTGTDLKKLEYLSPTDVTMRQNASINAGGAASIDTGNLIPFQYEQTGVIQDTTLALQEQQMVLLGLSDQFAGFFSNIDGGFEGMIDGVIQGIQRLVTELLAKAAILAILTAITGGTVSGATFAPLFKGLDVLKGSASVGNTGALQGVSVVGTTVVSGRDLNIVWERTQNMISANT